MASGKTLCMALYIEMSPKGSSNSCKVPPTYICLIGLLVLSICQKSTFSSPNKGIYKGSVFNSYFKLPWGSHLIKDE